MIFCTYNDDNDITLSKFIETATNEGDKYLLFIGSYDEEAGTIFLTDENIILESGSKNIHIKQIGVKTKKDRGVLIAYSGEASHGGRMKISKIGKNANRDGENIEIHFNGKDIVLGDGCNIRKIGMDTKELNIYKDLYDRNKELINLANKKYNNIDAINDALKNDEILRNKKHKIVVRDKDGNATIYDENHPDIVEKRINLKGEEIE